MTIALQVIAALGLAWFALESLIRSVEESNTRRERAFYGTVSGALGLAAVALVGQLIYETPVTVTEAGVLEPVYEDVYVVWKSPESTHSEPRAQVRIPGWPLKSVGATDIEVTVGDGPAVYERDFSCRQGIWSLLPGSGDPLSPIGPKTIDPLYACSDSKFRVTVPDGAVADTIAQQASGK